MSFLDKLARLFRREEIDADERVQAQADAQRLAYDRDSIRVSQGVQTRGGGGSMTPTPDNLHAERDER
jgi:hypothetical protein